MAAMGAKERRDAQLIEPDGEYKDFFKQEVLNFFIIKIRIIQY